MDNIGNQIDAGALPNDGVLGVPLTPDGESLLLDISHVNSEAAAFTSPFDTELSVVEQGIAKYEIDEEDSDQSTLFTSLNSTGFASPALQNIESQNAIDALTGEVISLFPHPEPMRGDADGDCDIDTDDLDLILAARNTYATGAEDLRDVDEDGRITVLDARQIIVKLQENTDFDAPVLSVELKQDTAPDGVNKDGISHDITVKGTVDDVSPVTSLLAGFDDTPVEEYIKISEVIDENGNFQLSTPQLQELNGGKSVSPGEHTLYFLAKDKWGNEGERIGLTFTLDNLAPRIQNIRLIDDTGISNSDLLTSDGTIIGRVIEENDLASFRVGFTGSDQLIDFTDALDSNGNFTLDENRLEQINNGNPLEDGEYNFTFIATDTAGNTDSTEFSYTLDKTPPNLRVELSPESDTGELGDNVTTESTVNLVGQTEPNSTVILEGTDVEAIADSEGRFTLTEIALEGKGENKFTLISTDIAGNQNTTSLSIFREEISTVAPVIDGELANDTGVSDRDNLTSDPTITGQIASETNIASLEANLNGNGFIDISSGLATNNSFEVALEEYVLLTSELPDGEYSVALRATDSNGLVSNIDTINFTLDRAEPLITLELAPESDTGDKGDSSTRERTVTLIGQTDPGLRVVLVETQQEVIADSDGKFSFTDVPLAIAGDKLFSVVTQDAAGNQGRASRTIIREGINGAPTITSAPATSIDSTQTDSYDYQVTATDPDGDELSYALLDSPLGAEIDENGLLSFELPDNPLPAYDFTVEVNDGRGGTDTQTFTVDVTDVVETSGTISGVKWNDLNGNGVRDANEPGLSGVTIYLDNNNNGVLDGGEPVQVTAQDNFSTPDIDETGEYSFTNLAPDTYIVREVVPNGFEQTFPSNTENSTGDGFATASADFYTIDLTEGEIVRDVNFGNQETITGVENNAPEFISNPITEFFAAIPSTPDGTVDPSLITLNVNESSVETVSLTVGNTGGGTGVNGADLVFIVDESGSMAGEQAWLTDTILELDNALQARGIDDNRYSLIGFTDSTRNLAILNQPEVSIYDYGNQLLDTLNLSEGLAEFLLPGSGNYTVVLSDANGQVIDYDLSVAIGDGEQITPTGFDLIYSRTIAAGEEQTFTFDAPAGLKVYFDGISSTSSRIRGSLVAPSGEVIDSFLRSNFDASNPYTLKETGTYTLRFDGGSDGGDYSYRLLNLSDVPTLSLDTSVRGNLDLPNGSQAFKIEGTAGQRLYLNSTVSSFFNNWTLYGADNNQIVSSSFRNDLEAVIPGDGTYWLVLEGRNDTSTEYDFQIVTPETTIETISLGETVSGTIGEIGEEAIYQFTANAGDAVWFDGITATSSFFGPNAEIYAPNGERILSSIATNSDRGILTLSETGVYSVIVRSDNNIPGDYSFRILDIDGASNIEIGENVSSSLSPGNTTQFFKIEGSAGQKLFFDSIETLTSFSGEWNLYSPGNDEIIRSSFLRNDFEVALPSDGAYHLILDGNSNEDINFSFQVLDISTASATATGFDTIYSSSLNPEETETFTFNGNAGQRIFFDGLSSTNSLISAAFDSSDGSSIFRFQRLDSDNEVYVLPDSGTYNLTVNGGSNGGDYSFRILDLDNADSIELDSNTTIELSEGLGTEFYQFEGTQGANLFFDSLTSVSGRWQLYFPGTGEELSSSQVLNNDFETVLPADGIYTLAISNSSGEATDFTFNIATSNREITAINFGEIVNSSLDRVGEVDSYTFTGTAGQKILLDGLASDSSEIEARLISPTNNRLFGGGSRVISPTEDRFGRDRLLSEDAGTITLTEDGTYTLRVSGGDSTGSYSFQIIDVDQAEALSNGDNIQGLLNAANASEIFPIENGIAGQTITISASSEIIFSNANQASNNTSLFRTDQGGREDGYLGLDAALNLPFREGAAVNLVLITDEDRDTVNSNLDFGGIFNAISAQNALLNSINNVAIEDSEGNTALGVDSANNVYTADGSGGFIITELGEISSESRREAGGLGGFSNLTPIEDYVNLALATGGAAWDLEQFREGGLSATSFTESFVSIKAEEVSQQLAVDVIISSPDVEFTNLTGQLSGFASGETANFDVSFTTDNQVRSFDLLFVRPNTNTVLGSIPVVVNEVYGYDAFATDADGDILTYSLLEAPEGAEINPQTGEIAWGGATPGTYDFTLQVEDGRGGSDTQTFELNVTGTTPQEFGAISGQKWEDLNGDGVRDANEPGLAGVTVYLDENNNGVFDDGESTRITTIDNPATPDIDETGEYKFSNLLPDEYTVREVVTEGLEQTFPNDGQYTVNVVEGETVTGIDFGNTVVEVNQLPLIVSTPVTEVVVDTEYTYDVRANDPNGDSLTYALLTAPDGMNIDNEGLITWSPDALGTFTVEIEVSDGRGGITTQSYDIVVSEAVNDDTETTNDTEDPTVNLGINSRVLEIGETLNLQIQGFDNVAVADLNLSIDGTSLVLTPDVFANGTINTASFTTNNVGVFELEATATDTAGNTDTKTQTIRFIDSSDTEAPDIQIDLDQFDPSDPVIRERTDLIGTVEDDIEFYRVELAPTSLIDIDNQAANDPNFITIAEGNEGIDGVLGTIDPTLFRNDNYFIRVVAQDFNGNINIQGVFLGIDTPNKPGEFSQEFTDLSIPLTGVPIEITRRYSSLDSNIEGDFGFGWSLGVEDAQIQESVPVSDLELRGVPTLFSGSDSFTQNTRVTLNTPDGRRVGFTFDPVPRAGLIGTIWQPRFTPDPGVFDTLEVSNAALRLKSDGTFAFYLVGFPYNPRNYTLTTKDGTAYTYDQFNGLQSVEDRNGNTLTYTDDGIVSSTGASIEFIRDGEGRIERIIDSQGNAIEYDYDANGNLVGVTDREENETTFKYEAERANYLTEIVDPLGRSGTRVEYADNGRISRFIDADGNALEIDFGDASEFQTINDPLGNTTTLFYDDRGNVVRQVDALGGETVSTYDNNNNLLTRTDGEGNTTSFTYDNRGNVLTQTDGEGNTTTFTYNEFSQVLTTTNALGEVATNVYDGDGNLLRTTDGEENTTTYSYDARGNLTQQTDANGNITEFGYNAFGLLTNITQELNGEDLVSTLGYDNNSNLTSITTPEGRTTTFAYDGESRLVSATDAAGNTSTIEYDATGQRTATVDALGRRTRFEYNDRGLLTKTIFADGTEQTNQYDILDRLIATTNPNGDTTRFEYNALDDLIAVVDAANNRTTYGRDLVGNLISQTDALNRTTTYTYDGANRLLTTQLPIGQTFTNTYDTVGNIIRTNDFNGDVLNYDYDGLGQLLEISTGDGTVLEGFTYTPTGQIATINDERGLTAFAYDQLDRLTRRTDPDNSFIAYTYDGDDNITSLTTPSGTVGYGYDAAGFLDTVIQRDGNITDYDYDAVGNLIQTTFSNGVVETATFDTLNRVEELATTDSSGNVIASYQYTFDNLGNRLSETDNTGRVTNYEYNEINQVTEVAVTDANLGNETTNYEYNAAGNVTNKTDSNGETTYIYDENDRLIREESDGQTTTYNYDDGGNRIDKRINGVIVEVYDWNIQGELAGASIINGENTTNTQYEYNSDGIRVSQTVDGVKTNFLIDNNQQEFAQVIEEYDSNIIQVVYTHGLDLISQERGSETGYYHTDSLGSTRFLTNDAGDIINTYLYDAYGSIINQTEILENSYKFTGEQFDSNLESYYLRARYYDPAAGRFVSRDPFAGFLERPLSLNDYLYGEGNPINAIDPSGNVALTEYISIATSDLNEAIFAFIGALQGFSASNLTFVGNVLGQASATNRVDNFLEIAFSETRSDLDNLEKTLKPFSKGNNLTQSFFEGGLNASITLKLPINIRGVDVGEASATLTITENISGFKNGTRFGLDYIKAQIGLS